MRTKQEIINDSNSNAFGTEAKILNVLKLILEVVLDSRELLAKKNEKVTQPNNRLDR